MRILHLLASRAPGGAEVLTRDLAVELSRRGHRLAVAFVSQAADLGNSVEFEEAFEGTLQAASVATYDIGHHAKRNPVFGAFRLAAIVRRFRPDILHIHLQAGLLFRLLSRGFLPAGLVTVYTHHIDRLKFGPRLFRLLTAPVQGFVAISRQTGDLLRGHVHGPVVHIPNAVAFSPRPPVPRRDDGTIRILSVGRLFPQKDYPGLVRVAARLFALRPDLAGKVVFTIAGEGPERATIESLIRSERLDGRVVLLGTRTDVSALMREADLLLMTSSYEGLPITLLEALHARLPIVATDVGGCGEVVEHGQNGYLAAHGDIDALAGHILRLVQDPQLRARLARASGRRAVEYGIARSADRHLRLYGDLAGNASNPPGSQDR